MKTKVLNFLTRVSVFCVMCVAMASSGVAMAQDDPADNAAVEIADHQSIIDAYRVDKDGGVLATMFDLFGSATNYLWLAGLVFVVGWMAYKKFRTVA